MANGFYTHVVYDAAINAVVRLRPFEDAYFRSQGAATRFVNKMKKKGDSRDLVVAEVEVYNLLVAPAVKMVTRVNLMSGKEYQEPINTPSYLSPSSEAYWSN